MPMPSGAYSSNQARKEKIPSGYGKFAINNYTPEQEAVFAQSGKLLDPSGFTSKLAMGDQSAFAEMEAPALRQFNELSGGLASKFSGMGMGARKSSGFQNTLSAASQDFASQLQAKRLELRNQAIKDMMGMSEQFLSFRPQETGLYEKKQKTSGGWGTAIGAGLGAIGGSYFGNPMMGAQLGASIGSGF